MEVDTTITRTRWSEDAIVSDNVQICYPADRNRAIFRNRACRHLRSRLSTDRRSTALWHASASKEDEEEQKSYALVWFLLF